MKVLNLYAGIGGNRKLWEDVEVTAVEYNKDIAAIYQDFFPKDKVVISRKQEKVNANKAIVARNKAIMAVPQNPITTQEFYMRKSYIATPDTEPTRLSSNGWMGRP